MIDRLLLSVEREQDRLFFAGADQKFLQMLVSNGISGHALVQRLVNDIFPIQDLRKDRISKEMKSFPHVFPAELFEILQRLDLRIESCLGRIDDHS